MVATSAAPSPEDTRTGKGCDENKPLLVQVTSLPSHAETTIKRMRPCTRTVESAAPTNRAESASSGELVLPRSLVPLLRGLLMPTQKRTEAPSDCAVTTLTRRQGSSRSTAIVYQAGSPRTPS